MPYIAGFLFLMGLPSMFYRSCGDVALIRSDRFASIHYRPMTALRHFYENVPRDDVVRQQTPLSPALRLGADRLFIVGVSAQVATTVHGSCREDSMPIDGWNRPENSVVSLASRQT